MRRLEATWLGRLDYGAAWERQRELFADHLRGSVADTLMLLEHPHTYTLGRRSIEDDLLYDEAQRRTRGISLYRVDRGGRATYHGPGQLVGYPIMALGERYDVLWYLRKLEEVLIKVVAQLGVSDAVRDPEHTGVWVGQDKIGAIGVKITRGITMHGFALNVTTDLDMFGGIVPCGIEDRGVTSVEKETGVRHPVREVGELAAEHLSEVFDIPLVWRHPAADDAVSEPGWERARGAGKREGGAHG